MPGADGAGDLSFGDDGIGHSIGLLLIRISRGGHFELGSDQHLGRHGYGGIELIGLFRLPLTDWAALKLGVHNGAVLEGMVLFAAP